MSGPGSEGRGEECGVTSPGPEYPDHAVQLIKGMPTYQCQHSHVPTHFNIVTSSTDHKLRLGLGETFVTQLRFETEIVHLF